MADLTDLNFNADEHDEVSFGVIPKGWCAAIISGITKVESKNKPGNHYLNVEYSVQTEGFKGRKIWQIVNLWNKNSTAVEIAQRDFAGICRAVGIMCPKETSELLNIPLGIKVAHRDYKGTPQEDIKGYCSEAGLLDKEQISTEAPVATGGAGQQPWMAGSETGTCADDNLDL